MQLLSMVVVILISLIGVWIFNVFSLPVPWMLGSLFAVLTSQFFIKKLKLKWPVTFRDIGLVIVGVAIGGSFQFDLFASTGWLILLMFILNITLVIATVILAFCIKKWGRIPLKTALTCTVPGGLSQIVTFAGDEKDIDIAVVTYFHVIRVISIVMVIPFVISGHIVQPKENVGFHLHTLVLLSFLLIGAWVFALIGKRIKIPVPFFITPVLLVIFLQLTSASIPVIPLWLLHMAQLFIGAYIGLLLKPSMLKLGTRIIVTGILSALALLGITFLQGFLLCLFLQYSLQTSFLSTAAGGLDQMSLLAAAVGADVSTVTVFQMFRLLFVFIVVLPLLKVTCEWLNRRHEQLNSK